MCETLFCTLVNVQIVCISQVLAYDAAVSQLTEIML